MRRNPAAAGQRLRAGHHGPTSGRERRGRRRASACNTEAAQAAVAAVAAVELITGWLSLPLLFTAAALLGAGQAVKGAARMLLMRSVVPPEQLTQALTQDEVRMNGSALAGPVLGGALYAVRALAHAIPFLFAAGSFLVALITAALMKTPAARPASTHPAGGSATASGNMLA